MRPRVLLLIVACVVGLAALACTGDEDATPEATPTVSATPILPAATVTLTATSIATSTATPAATTEPPRRTGDPSIDAILDAVDANRPEAIADRIALLTLDCVTQQEGIGAPPLCEDGEADGTPVQVFPIGQCEGHYTRDAEAALERFISTSRGLYAVADASGASAQRYPDWPLGETWLVFYGQFGPRLWGMRMALDGEGQIVNLLFGCNSTEGLVSWGAEALPLIAGPWTTPGEAPAGPPTSGFAPLDGLIRAVYDRDAATLEALAGDTFEVQGCHIFETPPAAEALREFLGFEPVLYAAYQAPAPSGGWWLAYRLTEPSEAAARLHAEPDGTLVEISYPCGHDISSVIVDEDGRPLVPVLQPEVVRQ